MTHWDTEEPSAVTQAEATVEEDIPILILEQEEQGRETSLVGQAAPDHCHLSLICGTPGREDEQDHQGQYTLLLTSVFPHIPFLLSLMSSPFLCKLG